MKIHYVLVALLFFLFIFGTYYASNYTSSADVKQVFNIADLKSNCQIKEMKENADTFDISVYYPETLYEKLNISIQEQMIYYINYFKNEISKISHFDGRKFELQITFSSYEYENYISYVFEIFEDYGGAHPNTTIWTISYNIKEKKIIDIKYLVDKNKEVLKILSEESFDILKEDEAIKEAEVEEMILAGIKPKENNFTDFAFTQEGLKVFFERYSIAPYALGDFVITIPYNKLNIL